MIEAVKCSYAVVESPEDLESARAIRIAVFVEEQGIPRELELDALDAEATHVLARDEGYAAAELSPHEYLEQFYAALGYRRVPGEEEVAGHRLIRMRKELA